MSIPFPMKCNPHTNSDKKPIKPSFIDFNISIIDLNIYVRMFCLVFMLAELETSFILTFLLFYWCCLPFGSISFY
tara:strand:+ start:546 stop:770 length:225 start_codon:yes stop_codon:yes gene_type:complete